MLPDWKIMLWLAVLAAALVLIGFNPDPQGYKVVASGEQQLPVGTVINAINGSAPPEALRSNFTGIVRVDTSEGAVFVRADGPLRIEVEKQQPTNLRFGLDLKGGVRALLKPREAADLEQARSVLQQRINIYGLRDATFRVVTAGEEGFIEVSMAGASISELRDLLEKQGKFEAKIPVRTSGTVRVDSVHDVSAAAEGDVLTLDGTRFEVVNKTSPATTLLATVFTGEDVRAVFFDPQRSRIEPAGAGYVWSFGVQISPDGAERFAKVTQNLAALPSGYLDAPIMFFLDGALLDELSIGSSLKGQVATEVSVSGSAATMDEAVAARARLQSILRSGALPTSMEIVSLEEVSPSLGGDFVRNAALAGIGAVIGVAAVVTARYRNPKLIVPMMVVSLSEVVIILGASVAIGWTLDLAAIAGIIAAIGTGVDSQIIIIDQASRGAAEGMKEKLRRAFFVIFGAGGVMIAAMLPLMIFGLGLLRGFAIITIIGVLVGILITRPAFGVMASRLVK